MADDKNMVINNSEEDKSALDNQVADKSSRKQKRKSKNNSNNITNSSNTSNTSKKYRYVIKNRAIRKHSQRRKVVMSLMVFLAITILLGGSVYGILVLIEYNNFKVMIDKDGLNILSLSHTEDFANPSEVISLGGPKFMDNITLMDIYYLLPEIQRAEGTYGDENTYVKYLAATFFLKNISGEDRVYRESMLLREVTKGIDEAIRIMVVRNGEIDVYARPQSDGTPEEVVPGQMYSIKGEQTHNREEVWMTTSFDGEYVFYNSGIPLAANETVRYTLLIWLEGWDEQCVDDILGGKMKVEMQFSRVS